ncbi:hypothetical protein [Piscibacillus salipiscarius]|uniref:Uncharacterized protein n=1 Tax=Piscibacillus salipiscarius TaxID=299480 RepID=A0ABW5QC28_9BACI
MSMPTIPPEPHRPDKNDVVIDLLESIALEEIALANLMKAEAEKMKAFVGDCCDFPSDPTNEEIIKFNRNVNQFLETLVMKEWLLLRKLQNVTTLFHDSSNHCHHKHDDCDHHDHYEHHEHKPKRHRPVCKCSCSECQIAELKGRKCHCIEPRKKKCGCGWHEPCDCFKHDEPSHCDCDKDKDICDCDQKPDREYLD